jgi:radical SAM protein with 4Fe4S-binding SPASM domain
MLHPEEVSKWKRGEQIYPLYVEISPTSLCNLHCNFCALDFIKRGDGLDELFVNFGQMAYLGVKSIMFAGEGEPLIHPKIDWMAQQAKSYGIDVALTTNGLLLKRSLSLEILPVMSWIKISLASAVRSTFNKICGVDGIVNLQRVLENLYEAIQIRNNIKYNCDIGVQMLVTEENEFDIGYTIETVRDLGADYIVLKQYSKHPASGNVHKTPGWKENFTTLSTDSFKVIQRDPVDIHLYDRCYGLPFWSYIASNGDVWACSAHMPDERFVLGNIYKSKMEGIWAKENYERVQKLIDVSKCRVGCRMNKCNEYLHELINPNQHVNFI